MLLPQTSDILAVDAQLIRHVPEMESQKNEMKTILFQIRICYGV